MSKTFIAVIRAHGTNCKVVRIDKDYATKKDYARDCRANGYYVNHILTVDELHKVQSEYKNRTRLECEEVNKLYEKYGEETLEILSDVVANEEPEQSEQGQSEPEQKQTEQQSEGNTPERKIVYKIDILKALKEAGYNQGRIKKEKLLNSSAVDKIRTGNTDISLKTVSAICNLLNAEPGDILTMVAHPQKEGKEEPEQSEPEQFQVPPQKKGKENFETHLETIQPDHDFVKWHLNYVENDYFPHIKSDFDIIKSIEKIEERNTLNEWEMTRMILDNNLDITPCIENCILKEIHFITKHHTTKIVVENPELGESDQGMYNIFSPLIKYAERKANLIYNCPENNSKEVINAAKACIMTSILLNELLENNLFPQFRLELAETLSKAGSENLAVCAKKNELLQGLGEEPKQTEPEQVQEIPQKKGKEEPKQAED